MSILETFYIPQKACKLLGITKGEILQGTMFKIIDDEQKFVCHRFCFGDGKIINIYDNMIEVNGKFFKCKILNNV